MPAKQVSRCMATDRSTYHWLDVWMWHSIELVEVKLELRTNIDVSALVLGGVTVLWCREYCKRLALSLVSGQGTYLLYTFRYAPLRNLPSAPRATG